MKVVEVNKDKTAVLHIDGEHFEGNLTVRIKGYLGPASMKEQAKEPESGYFSKESRHGKTWSIAVQGRFKQETAVNDVLFGNQWDVPIRDYLPYGTSAALQFGKVIDPGLETDLYSDTPWALSPLFSTMPFISVSHVEPSKPLPPWDSGAIEEDVSGLFEATPAQRHRDEGISLKGKVNNRRHFFADKSKVEGIVVGPSELISCDFAQGFISFETLSLKLPIGLPEFPLAKYWNGKPITFVARSRDGSRTFFRVSFDIAEESLDSNADHERGDSDAADEGAADAFGID